MGSARRVVPALVTVVIALSACGEDTQTAPSNTASTPTTEFAAMVRDRVSAGGMMTHLTKLQEIADAHDGNRALGTEGYQASVDYVADALRTQGFDVQITDFGLQVPYADPPTVSVNGIGVTAVPLQYTVGTPPSGVSGSLVAAPVEDTPGCTADDYDGLPVERAVVLVDDGQCPFSDKEAAAAQRGAVALIVVNNVDGDQSGATLGEQTDVTIPVVSVSKSDGARLRARPGEASITLNAGVLNETSRNVIAQTKTGSTTDVVVMGAHLDSVPAGPGINDNGSGVAAVLETALQMGSSPPVRNAVRFGFWGGEEIGLVGSADYVRTLDDAALKDIALYVNVDMIASPNPGYFTMDGDQSTPLELGQRPPRVPEGSAGIERNLVAYLSSAGKTAQDTSFEGGSDYDAFTRAGIPAGGIFTGAETKMTEAQAELWGGGAANEPFDPNYHQKTDTINHIDQDALQINGKAVAYLVGTYAQDLSGRNGIPLRADRTRHELPKP